LDCGFWLEVEKRMKSRGKDFSLRDFRTRVSGSKLGARLYHYPIPGRWLNEIKCALIPHHSKIKRDAEAAVDNCEALARVVTELENTRMFADATKNYHHLRPLSRRTDIDLRLIHLIRDGRGVVDSWMKHKNVKDIKKAAGFWLHNNTAIERAMSYHFPTSFALTVRLEDICRDPDKEMHRIGSFLGLSPQFKTSNIDNRTFHIIGNSMRLKPIEAVRLDEKWRRNLTPAELDAFNAIAGPMNRRYGYV
jgi:hypothetical protein